MGAELSKIVDNCKAESQGNCLEIVDKKLSKKDMKKVSVVLPNLASVTVKQSDVKKLPQEISLFTKVCTRTSFRAPSFRVVFFFFSFFFLFGGAG